MKERERAYREQLLSDIRVEKIEDDDVSIICPNFVSQKLYQHFVDKHFPSSRPKPAIRAGFSDDEIVVSISLDEAKPELGDFVQSIRLMS